MSAVDDTLGTRTPRLTDGSVVLEPYEAKDAPTIMALDADVEIQRWFDWPLTPTANDVEERAARLAAAERVVADKRRAWQTGEEFAFIIHDAESDEGSSRGAEPFSVSVSAYTRRESVRIKSPSTTPSG